MPVLHPKKVETFLELPLGRR